MFYITEQLSNLCVLYRAIFVNTGLIRSVSSSSNFYRYFQYNCIAHINMAAFLILLLFPIWGSPRFWVGFVIHFVIHGCALAHSHRFIHYQVFGLCLSKAECLPGSWSNAGTYGKNIELYIFQELLLSTFLYGVTSSKILTTFCFLFKDKYFLSFYMLHAAFQKHAGEFETPAVSFQDLFEDPWAMYSLFSSWVAAGSVLNADSKRTVSSLSVSPKSIWG